MLRLVTDDRRRGCHDHDATSHRAARESVEGLDADVVVDDAEERYGRVHQAQEVSPDLHFGHAHEAQPQSVDGVAFDVLRPALSKQTERTNEEEGDDRDHKQRVVRVGIGPFATGCKARGRNIIDIQVDQIHGDGSKERRSS